MNARNTYEEFQKAMKDIGSFKATEPALKKALEDFKNEMVDMTSWLEKAADSKEVAQARIDFAKDKVSFEKAKNELVAKKDMVNKSQSIQVSKLSMAKGTARDANKAAIDLMNALKSKTEPEDALEKKVSLFAKIGLPKLPVVDDPKTIDDEL